jgi:hypothetical protein
MNVSAEAYETIRRTVLQWPAEMRFALLRDLIYTLAPADKRPEGVGTLSMARGLLRANVPPPSDEQVEQWLGERRQEKYG